MATRLKLNVATLIGTTPMVKTTEHPPPFLGWWNTEREDLPGITRRRWWDGQFWSGPVDLDDSDDDVESARWRRAAQVTILWSGLQMEHPDGYSYQLTRTERSMRARWIFRTKKEKAA